MHRASWICAVMFLASACGGATAASPPPSQVSAEPAPVAAATPGVSRADLEEEARTNLHAAADCIAVWFYGEHWEGGVVSTSQLPPGVPRTEGNLWPDDAPLGWQTIAFTPQEPQHCAYEYARAPDGLSFVLSADCGAFVMERHGLVDAAASEVTLGEVTTR